MNRFLPSLTLLATLSAAPFATAAAEPAGTIASTSPFAATSTSCNRVMRMDTLHRRLVGKAADGPAALRNFIWITRGIYQLDMADVVTWLDSERAAETACVAAAGGSMLVTR